MCGGVLGFFYKIIVSRAFKLAGVDKVWLEPTKTAISVDTGDLLFLPLLQNKIIQP